MSNKPPKRVLEWVNRQRAKYNAKPLKAIPRGVSCDAGACPIAIALCGGRVRYAEVWPDEAQLWVQTTQRVVEGITVPEYVGKFIARFDSGAYPELVNL